MSADGVTSPETAKVKIAVKRLPHGRDLDLPVYASALAAGADVRAAVPVGAPVSLSPGGRALIPLGFALAIPPGWEVQVRPRSGLALKHGVTCLNTPGTIDADYRGEVHVMLINHGDEPFLVERGARVAQIVVARAPQAAFEEVEDLDETARGSGGFGSTGV